MQTNSFELPRPTVAAHPDRRQAEPASFGGLQPMDLLSAVLDHLQHGLVVVDAELQVHYANRAATLAHDLPINVSGGRLTVNAAQGREGLLRAVATSATGRWSLVMLQGEGEPLPLVALPLQLSSGGPALTLLMFGAVSTQRGLAMQFMSQACGLTTAEARVLRGLVEGHSPNAIAREHGIGVSTVRSQISSARSKTESRSITDLVRRVAALPPVMPAGANRAVH